MQERLETERLPGRSVRRPSPPFVDGHGQLRHVLARGVQDQGQGFAVRRFEDGELAVDHAGRHEVAGALGNGGVQFEVDKAEPGHGLAQAFAVAAL